MAGEIVSFNTRPRVSSLFLVLLIPCLGIGCLTYTGSATPKPNRILLSQGNQAGSWQTNDVGVEYQFRENDGQLEISGQVNFTDQIADTFNTVDYFKLIAAFFDDNGKKLGTTELLTNSNFSSRAGRVQFRKEVSLPQGATSFTFGYSGQAHSSSTGDAEPFTKSFSHKPTQ